MRKHVSMKKLVSVLLIIAMFFTGSSTVYAKQDCDKDCGNDKVDLVITNIPEKRVLTVNAYWDFDAKVITSGHAKGKVEKGIICWEISDDTAGVGSISKDGVVTPTQEGCFKVRALYFQNDKKYDSWLKKKHKNENEIMGSSEWIKINVQKPKDNTAPIICLNGSETYHMYMGDTYVEQGVTAWDDVHGDISGNVIINSNLNTEFPGIYQITYDVSDTAGNAAVQVKRTVILAYRDFDVAYINGDRVIFLTVGEEYLDPGVTIITKDGQNQSSQVIAEGEVDVNIPDAYEILYKYHNLSDGFNYELHRTVIVSEAGASVAPVIALIVPSMTFMAGEGSGDWLQGIYSAYDDKEGNITDRVSVGGDWVDYNTPGIYTVTFDVSDLDGNAAATQLLTIIIQDPNATVDMESPVITLNGDPAIFLTAGDIFVDPGVTAIDNVDGDISSRVELSDSNLDVNNAGIYYQLFTVEDSSGNHGVAVRYIVVSEPDTPVLPLFILSNYYDPQMVQIGSEYVPQKFLAYDQKDGNISDKVIIGGDVVDSSVEGIYYVTYDVQNSDGLCAYQLKIKVVVTDLNNPIDYVDPDLQLLGDSFICLNAGDSYVEPGYQAIDDKDGDITESVKIDGSLDINVAGLYTLTYIAEDNAGNKAVQYRYIQVLPLIDYEAPVITLNGGAAVFLTVGDTFTDPGVTAADNVDGDISSKVILYYSDINMNQTGTYLQLFMVEDSSGNISYAERFIVVSEPDTPVAPIFILGGFSYPQLIQIGSEYIPQTFLAYDKKDGDISDKVVIGGDVVNTNVEGVYYVTYDVQNSDGLNANQFVMKVVVTDLNNPLDYTEPDLRLLGDYYMYINVGDIYTEPGYTALDDRDGDITGSVTVDGFVDTSTAGEYWLYYTVIDSAGNKTVQCRIVSVMPVVNNYPRTDLKGDYIMYLTVGEEFVDPGVIIINAEGEDLSSQVVIEGTVDTNTPGEYIITYTINDFDGYTIGLQRKVIVSE